MKRFAVVVIFVVQAWACYLPHRAAAGPQAEALATLAASAATIEKLRADPNLSQAFTDSLQRAWAVVVVPQAYKGGFIIGASFGNALMVVRDKDGTFSPPAFYRLRSGSAGLQIGVARLEMVMTVMSEQALAATLSGEFQIGVAGGLTVAGVGAEIGVGAADSTQRDILVFSLAQGAYGGGGLAGSRLSPRQDWNHSLYGATATPRDILIDRKWILPDAETLYHALRVPSGAWLSPARPNPQHPGNLEQDGLSAPLSPVQITPLN